MGTIVELRPRDGVVIGDDLPLAAGAEGTASRVPGWSDPDGRMGGDRPASAWHAPVAARWVRRRVSPAVRRRRVVAALAGLAVVLLAFPPGGGGRAAASPAGAARPGAVYTVQRGDSLWSIAQRLDPSGDPRVLVDQMAAETGSDTVVPGERISLP